MIYCIQGMLGQSLNYQETVYQEIPLKVYVLESQPAYHNKYTQNNSLYCKQLYTLTCRPLNIPHASR
ncbi:hypothetical protein D3C80_1664780 [compost metagenome]